MSHCCQLLYLMSKPSTLLKEQHQRILEQINQIQLTACILTSLKQRAHAARLVQDCLQYLDNGLQNNSLKTTIVSLFEENEQHFLLLKKYINIECIKKFNDQIQFKLTKNSTLIANRPDVCRFVRRLISNTKSYILFDRIFREQAIQLNLRWLLELSQIDSTLTLLKKEQVTDLCFQTLKFEASNEKILVTKKKTETTVNIEDSRLKRASSIKQSSGSKKSASQNLDISLQILINYFKNELPDQFTTIISNERLSQIIKILRGFIQDQQTIISTLKLLTALFQSPDILAEFFMLDGINIIRHIKEQVTVYKVNEALIKVIAFFPKKQQPEQRQSLLDEPTNQVDSSKQQPDHDQEKKVQFGEDEEEGKSEIHFELQASISQLKSRLKKVTDENVILQRQSEKKDTEIETLNLRCSEFKEEGDNYKMEVIDQTRVISDKILQVKKLEAKVAEHKETITKLNELTGGIEFQEQMQDLQQQLEYVQLQNQQLEMLCEQQLQEIEQLQQVKSEQDELIQEIQKNAKYESVVKATLTIEEVGTPEDSRNSEVYELEAEVEQKDAYIQQLLQQLGEVQEVYEKVKFLEDKNRILKEKLNQSELKQPPRFFWDLEIKSPGSSLLSLVRNYWDFQVNNTEELAEHTQQVSVFAFEPWRAQQFIDNVFNYSKQKDGIFDSLSTTQLTYLKTITPSFLQAAKSGKQQQKPSSFLLCSRLLSSKNYQRGYFKLEDNKQQDIKSLEEFWLQFAFSQKGTVIFLCTTIGQEETEIIQQLCFFQLLQAQTQNRLLIFVVKETDFQEWEQQAARQICGDLQIMYADLASSDSGFKSPRVLFQLSLQHHSPSEFQVFFQQLIKHDSIKLKQPMSFVDQLREFIEANQRNFFEVPETISSEFKMESLEQDAQGFRLQLFFDQQKTKLKELRQTQAITSQPTWNMKFLEGGILLQITAPYGESFLSAKVSIAFLEGQGSRVTLKMKTAQAEQEDVPRKYLFSANVPQWRVQVKSEENLLYQYSVELEAIL